MSALRDQSKFDNLDYGGSDCSEECDTTADDKSGSESAFTVNRQDPLKSIAETQHVARNSAVKEGSEVGRYIMEYNGRKIYEWEQSLEEVNLYIDAPPSKRASDFQVNIQSKRLSIGLKGNDRMFIDEPTFSKVNTSESSWYLDSNIIHIIMMKVHRGETWEAALLGRHTNDDSGDGELVDAITKDKIKQNLMLERFQEENPGFDFRGAKFNGEAPDPRSFLNGIRHY